MRQPFPLERLSIPVLDLYGENEFPAVIKMAPERKRAMDDAGNRYSAQVMLPNADHYFTDQGDALVDAVTDWLRGIGSF